MLLHSLVRTDLCDYYWNVEQFDREVGNLIELLQRTGEEGNTLMVVTSDNGMPFPRCKSNLYDLGTRVPLAIRWPAKLTGNCRVEDLVSLVDLAPTILQAAGLQPPPDMTGKSLLGLLLSGTYKRPLLIVDGKRYELNASDKADASVAEMLAKFSEGDRGTYVVKGTPGAVNGVDGILIDSITPVAHSSARPRPAARQPEAEQTTPTVTSRVVTVGERQYTVYDYADPATKKFCGEETETGIFS